MNTSPAIQSSAAQFSSNGKPSPALIVSLLPLTDKEQRQFNECEHILRTGLHQFFDVGSALLTIRQGRLYRATHPTFESYCQERWGIGRSYAWRVIGAAERMQLLPPDKSIPKPTTEFQMRPFLKVEPKVFPKVWEQAVKRAKEGKVTETLAKTVISEISPATSSDASHSSKPKRSRKRRYGQLGQVLTLLQDARKSIQQGDMEHGLAVLDRIEDLLFANF